MITKELQLISVSTVKLTDKTDGHSFTKYKHLFMDKMNNPLVGWLDKKLTDPVEQFQLFYFDVKEFQGKLSYHLLDKLPKSM